MYSNDLESLIGVGIHLQLQLRLLFGLSEYHHFSYRPSLRLQGQVPSIFLCEFDSDLDRSRCTGEERSRCTGED
jgi:hypothetical protein